MPEVNPIRLQPFEGTRTHSTQMIHITSPWNPDDYMAVNFPEHCWGEGMSNVSHVSDVPIECPWEISEDGQEANLVRSPDEGITVRFTARVEGMVIHTEMEIENRTDHPVTDIRVLICARPRYMSTFCEFSHDPTFVWVGGEAVNIDSGTTYDGPMPEGREPCWALNLPGGHDNADMGWFRPGSGPGRIVNELADLPLIGVHEKDNQQKWVATQWEPARMLFSNPSLPCIHSDPQPPDCPPGESVRASGVILFHEGDVESLRARVHEVMAE